MLMQNTIDGSIRELDPSQIPEHKSYIWTPYTPPVPDPPTLDEVKAAMLRLVDDQAELCRLKYITPGAGQALTYDRKRREAWQAIDDPSPTVEKYPVLSASIGIEVADTGNAKTDFDAISTLVISMEQAWAALARVIEGKRLGAKAGITTAETVADAQAAAQVEWP